MYFFLILLTLNSGFFFMNVSIFANHYFHFFNLSDGGKDQWSDIIFIFKKIFYIYYIFMKMYAYVGIKIQYTILFVQNTVFKIYMDLNPNICICIHFHTYVIDIKYKFTYINYFGSERGIKARFASHLVQNGASKCVSRVIWFRRGIQSAFRESFGSERGSSKRVFASNLIQNGIQSVSKYSF